jgi:hypothetical protein
MTEAAETFLAVPEFPSYSCSNLGNLRNTRRGGVPLRGWINAKGLRVVTLRDGNGRRRHAFVHALVAALFIGPRPASHVVAHVSDDKLDNRPGNLVFLTRRELNHRTRERHPLRTAFKKGEGHRLAKLTESRVRDMRLARARGLKFRELRDRFGVSMTTVYRVLFRVSWGHVE